LESGKEFAQLSNLGPCLWRRHKPPQWWHHCAFCAREGETEWETYRRTLWSL